MSLGIASPSQPSQPRQYCLARKKRGSVLVAVLAIIALLSFLISRFMQEATEDLEYRALFNEPPEARAFAFSLLEVALATLNEVAVIDEGKLYAPEQGWADPLSYAKISPPNGWTARIEIRDAVDKIPLNSIPENALKKILENTFDFDFGTANELSGMLLDWIDSDNNRRLNGAETEDYLDENPPYKAANAPLQSLEELRLIKIWQDEFFDAEGRPNETFDQLASIFSVEHEGEVNLNAATAVVLESIAGEDEWFAESVFDDLESEQPYLKNVPASASDKSVSTEIKLLYITVTLYRGSVPYVLQALVEPAIQKNGSGGNNLPGDNSDVDRIKTGSVDEQEALKIPFKILQLTTSLKAANNEESARYSNVDI
jgi:general secretion pathway protein K